MVTAFPALEGMRVRLEPVVDTHAGDLARAALENPDIYRYTAVPLGLAATVAYLERLRAADAAGESVLLTQIRTSDQRTVGITRLVNFRCRPGGHRPYAVEIGGTWLAAPAQRTGINREAALEGIGARLEGVLRAWQPSQAPGEGDALRDSR